MDLKDFVAGSLTQIVEGIKKAQEGTANTGALISPAGANIASRKETPIMRTPDGHAYLHDVQFDVAVTVSDEKEAGAGASLRIFGAKLGAEGAVTYQNAAVSRVQFSVPVVWPGQILPELEKRLREEKQRSDSKVQSHNSNRPPGRMSA